MFQKKGTRSLHSVAKLAYTPSMLTYAIRLLNQYELSFIMRTKIYNFLHVKIFTLAPVSLFV